MIPALQWLLDWLLCAAPTECPLCNGALERHPDGAAPYCPKCKPEKD